MSSLSTWLTLQPRVWNATAEVSLAHALSPFGAEACSSAARRSRGRARRSPAVSARRIVGPSVTTLAPASLSRPTSAPVRPPSGPTTTATRPSGEMPEMEMAARTVSIARLFPHHEDEVETDERGHQRRRKRGARAARARRPVGLASPRPWPRAASVGSAQNACEGRASRHPRVNDTGRWPVRRPRRHCLHDLVDLVTLRHAEHEGHPRFPLRLQALNAANEQAPPRNRADLHAVGTRRQARRASSSSPPRTRSTSVR